MNTEKPGGLQERVNRHGARIAAIKCTEQSYDNKKRQKKVIDII
jgi:hypothetical protein